MLAATGFARRASICTHVLKPGLGLRTLDTKMHLNRWENRTEFCRSLISASNLDLSAKSKWVKDNEISIYDPHNEEQCEQARVALGYGPDYIDDFDVCRTFNDLLCESMSAKLER